MDGENTIESALEGAGLDPETMEPVETPPAGDGDGEPGSESDSGDPGAGDGADGGEGEGGDQPAAGAADDGIAKLADAVVAALAKATPAAPAKPAEPAKPEATPEVKPPAYIARLLNSEDEDVKADGQAALDEWKAQQERLADVERRLNEREDREEEAAFEAEMVAAVGEYVVPGVDAQGKPSFAKISKDEFDKKLVEWIGDVNDANNPRRAAAASLTAEQMLRVIYPEAVKRAKPSSSPKAPGPSHDDSSRGVRRVPGSPRMHPAGALPKGGGGNQPSPAAKPNTPPANEDWGDCVDRAFKELKLD